MREMKVRVWDDVLKEMLYSRVEQFDDMLGFRFEKHLETENPIYMWSTGLHDRNGTPIYEGDIVTDFSVPGPCDGIMGLIARTVYPVKFVNGCFVVECFESCASNHVFGHYHLLYEMDCETMLEVVGNVYQHPHLLKGDEDE